MLSLFRTLRDDDGWIDRFLKNRKQLHARPARACCHRRVVSFALSFMVVVNDVSVVSLDTQAEPGMPRNPKNQTTDQSHSSPPIHDEMMSLSSPCPSGACLVRSHWLGASDGAWAGWAPDMLGSRHARLHVSSSSSHPPGMCRHFQLQMSLPSAMTLTAG